MSVAECVTLVGVTLMGVAVWWLFALLRHIGDQWRDHRDGIDNAVK